MEMNEYQRLSQRTMPTEGAEGHTAMNKSNYAMGLAGESGELVDLIKKEVHHGHEPQIDKIKGELGDVYHYLAGIATMYGFTLEEIAEHNIDKLEKRYPSGFSTTASIERVDVT